MNQLLTITFTNQLLLTAPFIIIFLIFYFGFKSIEKRNKKKKTMFNNLKLGDKIMVRIEMPDGSTGKKNIVIKQKYVSKYEVLGDDNGIYSYKMFVV